MPKKRNKNIRPLKPLFHIFCEGEKTEPIYLTGYLNKYQSTNKRLQIIKIEKTKKNTPVQLVEVAIKMKKKSPQADTFWVVYDREGKHKYTDELHEKALQKAKSNGINIALTNVCFEVWLLLHFIEVTASYSCYDDLIKNSPLIRQLKSKGINKYDKADEDIFKVISDDVHIARKRAKSMNECTKKNSYCDRSKPHLLNPYSNVYKLLDAIDKFI